MSKKPEYKFKITVKMTEETMYDYLKYRVKTNAGTIFPYLFVALFVYQLVTTWGEVSIGQSIMYLIFSVVFAIGVPLNTRMQAKKSFSPKSQVKFSEPIDYFLTEEGITRGDEEEGVILWEGIHHIDTTALNIIIFATNKLALFIPKENIEDYPAVKEFLLSKIEPKRIRMDGR